MAERSSPEQDPRMRVVVAMRHLVADHADEAALLQHAVDAARVLLDASASWYAAIAGGCMRIAAHSGLRSPDMPRQWMVRVGDGIGGQVAASGQPTIVRDYRHDRRRAAYVKSIIDQEDFRSGVVVPVMRSATKPLGVLYVAQREPRQVGEVELRLTDSFAKVIAEALRVQREGAAASAAIAVAREESRRLRHDLQTLARLAVDVDAPHGLDLAVATLARRLGGCAVVRDAYGRELARAGNLNEPSVWREALPAGGEPAGALDLWPDGDLDEVDALFIQQVGALLGAELTKRRRRHDQELHMRGELLGDLVERRRLPEELIERAAAVGVDLRTPTVICVLGIRTGRSEERTRAPALTRPVIDVIERAARHRLPRGTLVVPRGGDATFIVPYDRSGELDSRMTDLVQEVSTHVGGLELACGIGSLCLSVEDYPAAYRNATLALEIARSRPAGSVVAYDSLGVTGVLAQSLDADCLHETLTRVLGPLLDHGRRAEVHLATLAAYFAHDRSLRRTAEVLHLHVNSVRYRLQRIQHLLGVDFDDADDRFLVELMVRVHQMLRLRGSPPERPGEASRRAGDASGAIPMPRASRRPPRRRNAPAAGVSPP